MPLSLASGLIATFVVADAAAWTTPAPPPVPIVGGQEVPLGRWDTVVAIQIGARFCTGTVVAPNLVLTAGHCVVDLPASAVDEVAVGFGPSAFMPAQVTGALAMGTFPDYCRECRHDRFDLGYIVLRDAASFPDGFPPLVTDQDTWDTVMVEGAPLTLVGYGQDQDGESTPGSLLGVGTKREVEVELIPFSQSGNDFRGGGDGLGTCDGDSGGPAFVQLDDGRWAVAGVLSGGFGACGEGSLFMVPLPALPWIRDETGIDLLPADCADATCVDTSFPADDGCGCRNGSSPSSWRTAALLMLIGFRRSRGVC